MTDRPQEPLVSVLTPVYNGGSVLRSCIESVLGQTYQNWEYVIVNNRSTDETLQVAQEYADRDPRIRIQTNSHHVRVIPNHNIAFRLISCGSKYCKVVAADDWLFPDCLERMVALAEANPSVGIVGAYGLWGREVAWDGLPFPSTVVSGREICRAKLLQGLYVFGAPTSLLFRSEAVRSRNLFFNESNLHADSEICLELLRQYDFGFVHQVLTYTRKQAGSLTSYSQRMNTYLAANLSDLTKYGPTVLSHEEMEARLSQHLKGYYEFLAKSCFHMRGPDFWKFHLSKLRELGYPLNRLRLAKYVVLIVLDATLNPKQTIVNVAKNWSSISAKVSSVFNTLAPENPDRK